MQPSPRRATPGAEVVLVSARGPRWVGDIAAAAGVDGRAICCNGAVVCDLAERRVLDSHPLRSEVSAALVAALRERAPGVAFASEREQLAIREPAYVPLWHDRRTSVRAGRARRSCASRS